jgi:hypothetical protein
MIYMFVFIKWRLLTQIEFSDYMSYKPLSDSKHVLPVSLGAGVHLHSVVYLEMSTGKGHSFSCVQLLQK